MSFHYSLTARRATWWNTSSHVGRAILHRAMSYVENDKEAIRVMEAAIGYKGLMFENI